MMGPAPSVSKVTLRLTEKSEVEFGGLAEVLASDEETMERVRADITNLPLSMPNGTAIANHSLVCCGDRDSHCLHALRRR
jgi:hypothetical protein